MRKAFTLTELLVSVATIGTLIAITLPAISGIRNKSRNAGCLAHLRDISQSFNAYRASYSKIPESFDDMEYPDRGLKCPSDLLGTESYDLIYFEPYTNIPDIDGYPSNKVRIAYDFYNFHGYKNAGYLDGHADSEGTNDVHW